MFPVIRDKKIFLLKVKNKSWKKNWKKSSKKCVSGKSLIKNLSKEKKFGEISSKKYLLSNIFFILYSSIIPRLFNKIKNMFDRENVSIIFG